jgi:AcrR family transcriptional regulator
VLVDMVSPGSRETNAAIVASGRARRRGRPNLLTREEVVEAAYGIASGEGLDALSMPRLAQSLGVSAMAIYTYVANKDELLNAVTTRARQEVHATSPDFSSAPWPDNVIGTFRHNHDLILARPGIGWLLIGHGREVAEGADDVVAVHLERILGYMVSAGISPPDAARLLEALSVYTTGFAVRRAARREADTRHSTHIAWGRWLRGLDPGRYPYLASVVNEVLESATDEQFEFGLRALIGGVARSEPTAGESVAED